MMRRWARILPQALWALTASAQAPLVSDASLALHSLWLAEASARVESSMPADNLRWSAGLLSVSRDSQGPWMPLFQGTGLGTTTLGQGLALQVDAVRHGWELSATLTALRNNEDGSRRGRLETFRLTKHTAGGWTWGLEKTPIQWGYGLFGGFLMGDAHDPVPRFVLESPRVPLSFFGVPLGSWGFETFLGRLEWDRQIPEWTSNPRQMEAILEAQGNLRRPNLSGFRLKAAFGPNVDMNFGVVSKWGGVDRQGRDIMHGLSWWNYPLGYLGAENVLVAETSGDAQAPDAASRFNVPDSYHNISNAVANVEVRIRFPETAERWFGAKAMTWYLSRGASNVNWQWSDFMKKPFSAWSHDLRFVGKSLSEGRVGGSGPDSLWGWAYAQSSPGLVHINDTIGLQWIYESWDFGLELADLHNDPYPASTFRVYSNGRNLSGHSRYGDSLGQPLGGEVYHQGLSLGLRFGSKGSLRLQVVDAIRFNRDIIQPDTTATASPVTDDHFFHVQMDAQWRFTSCSLGGSFAIERHNAAGFTPGNHQSNWIATLGYAVHLTRP